jgi:hypothetical protein
MQKDISYSGYTAQPSSYQAQDGMLDLCVDAVPENGALQPLSLPQTLFQVGDGETVMYIHQTSAYTHYIIVNASTGSIRARAKDSGSYINVGTVSGVTMLTSVGNTLIALATGGMRYFLFKPDTGAYEDLGAHLPELPMQFGLQYEWVKSDEFDVEYSGHWLMYDQDQRGTGFCNTFDDDCYTAGMTNSNYITQSVLAKANKFIADEATDAGRFIYPFFVRYAYRLFDGSYVMQSAPILMPCTTGCSPVPVVTDCVYNGNGDAHGYYESWTLMLVAPVFDLYAKVIREADIQELKNWSDIVKSVDIFISKPIYTYDINGTITHNDLIGTVKGQVYGKEKSAATYTYDNLSSMVLNTCRSSLKLLEDKYYGITPLPAKSEDAVETEIKDTSNFFFLKSLKLEELTTVETKVDIKEDYLEALVNRTQLTDDYDSHDTIIPEKAFAYNQRINLSGIKKQLFSGFWPQCLHTMQTAGNNISDIWVYVKQEGKDTVVHTQTPVTDYGDIIYFYYPNANAYKAVLLKNGTTYVEYTLSNHSFLNGAYFFEGFGGGGTTGAEVPAASTDTTIDMPSKVYTSQVNDPFYFPLDGINTVGTGKVLGISAATKALSQGQFGQFPLYAFSTDGVWALEVDTSGLYKAKQPVSRDVCVNADAITQTDSSVLFVTDRGIMRISGSATECITDTIDSVKPDTLATLPKAGALVTLYDKALGNDGTGTDIASLTVKPFSEFIEGCGIIYDYTRQRVIIYNPSVTYAYILSLKSGSWGMMRSNIRGTVNSYPDALAMVSDGGNLALADFATVDDNGGVEFIVTRPFKLGDNDAFKTVNAIIQRGTMLKGDILQVLYASNDLDNWAVVWSSADAYLRGFSGSPYKYYRLAVIASLKKGKCLAGCSVSYDARLTAQMR